MLKSNRNITVEKGYLLKILKKIWKKGKKRNQKLQRNKFLLQNMNREDEFIV